MIRSATFASAISPSTQADRNRNERRAAAKSSSSVIELSAYSSTLISSSSFTEPSSACVDSRVRAAASCPRAPPQPPTSDHLKKNCAVLRIDDMVSNQVRSTAFDDQDGRWANSTLGGMLIRDGL